MFLGILFEYAAEPASYFFSLPDLFFSEFPNICSVYLCIFVFTKYANPLKMMPLIIAIIIVYVISCLHWYLTGYIIRPHFRMNGDAPPEMSILNYSLLIAWIFVKYAIFGFGYYYASENIKHERKLRLLEKEKHEAEYAFLRAQINPHFLNNTLNFFFAKSLPLSDELADGIMTLSEIMRYSLEVDKEDGMALVDEEIKHIENVIKINQLRFNNKLQIQFNIHGKSDQIKIIPLILITIIENILKHGNCIDKINPVKIDLEFNHEQKMLLLKTWNLKKNGPKELSSGIGLDNIKKRLTHNYKKFILEIIEDEKVYKLELAMPMNVVIANKSQSVSSNVSIFNEIQL
ncbi:MAG: histidine kinase [Pedobacter sp.]|nr:MAG: histidine kinase [Pedobacter sp.]